MVRALSIQAIIIFSPRRPQILELVTLRIRKKTQKLFIHATGERAGRAVIHILEPLCSQLIRNPAGDWV